MSDNNTQPQLPMIDRNGIILVAPVAVAAPSDEDCVVHNLETGATYRLNDVGAMVWALLEKDCTIAEIATTIRAEYQLPDDVTPEQVVGDVTKVVADLQHFGLVILDVPRQR